MFDVLVFFLSAAVLESLPWQFSIEEVYPQIPQGLKVISSTLFDPKVGVDADVSGCAYQSLVLFVLYVLIAFAILVPFGESEVYDVDGVKTFVGAHEEILWLDVPVEVPLLVDELDDINLILLDMGNQRTI